MNKQYSSLPLIGFAAYSGTGKTTLLEALLPILTSRGLRIGVLKHAHHDFDIDKPGKDSYRLRKAGASQMQIASHLRHIMITETPDVPAQFTELINNFTTQSLDLILVEGCKNIAFPKIELHRTALDKPWLYPNDEQIIAVACDTQADIPVTKLDINDIQAIADFIGTYVKEFSDINGESKISMPCGNITMPTWHVAEFESVNSELCTGRILAEDIAAIAFFRGRRLSAMDIAQLRAIPVSQCRVYRPMQVALTGNSHALIRARLQGMGCQFVSDTQLDADVTLNFSTPFPDPEHTDKASEVPLTDTNTLNLIGNDWQNLANYLCITEPQLRAMQGERESSHTFRAATTEKISGIQGQMQWLPGYFKYTANGAEVTPISTITQLGLFNCIIPIPANIDTIKSGEDVTITYFTGRI